MMPRTQFDIIGIHITRQCETLKHPTRISCVPFVILVLDERVKGECSEATHICVLHVVDFGVKHLARLDVHAIHIQDCWCIRFCMRCQARWQSSNADFSAVEVPATRGQSSQTHMCCFAGRSEDQRNDCTCCPSPPNSIAAKSNVDLVQGWHDTPTAIATDFHHASIASCRHWWEQVNAEIIIKHAKDCSWIYDINCKIQKLASWPWHGENFISRSALRPVQREDRDEALSWAVWRQATWLLDVVALTPRACTINGTIPCDRAFVGTSPEYMQNWQSE
mmetsp:Transcript_458/g.825  ORF Transcript_458/g.825 Transcript_458/m.825 type:complete len:278 (-) Transcript_458:6277-7110(-)